MRSKMPPRGKILLKSDGSWVNCSAISTASRSPMGDVHKPPYSAAPVSGRAIVSNTAPLRSLVVEDDEDMRRLIERVLVIHGHEVNTCPDAESAWAAYQRETYSLVLLDWMLPGMDGLE